MLTSIHPILGARLFVVFLFSTFTACFILQEKTLKYSNHKTEVVKRRHALLPGHAGKLILYQFYGRVRTRLSG